MNLSYQQYRNDTEGMMQSRMPSYKQWCVQQRRIHSDNAEWKQQAVKEAKSLVDTICPLCRFVTMEKLCTSEQMDQVMALWEINKAHLGNGREQLERQTFFASSWAEINASLANKALERDLKNAGDA